MCAIVGVIGAAILVVWFLRERSDNEAFELHATLQVEREQIASLRRLLTEQERELYRVQIENRRLENYVRVLEKNTAKQGEPDV